MKANPEQSGGTGQPIRPQKISRPLPEVGAFVTAECGIPQVAITGVTLDSRAVVPGDLYAALPGANLHGARFASQAAESGAVALFTDAAGAEAAVGSGLPTLVVADPRRSLGKVSAWAYGNPARQLATIGITGTDGKTTTAMLLEAGLEAAGLATGLIGTVVTRAKGLTVQSVRTTPEAPDLHALLAVMVERGVQAVAMEVSSHALALGRVDGVEFDVAVFTNLGHDHLDFHHSQAEYFATKALLFEAGRAKRALIHIDDEWGRELQESLVIPTRSFAIEREADWTAAELMPQGIGTDYRLHGPDGFDHPAGTSLPGIFNVRNALAAAVAAIELGVDPAGAIAGVHNCAGVPGRMEDVVAGQRFVVLVDYAHTPDAVERALQVGQELAERTNGRLLVLLGCGGDRDKGKRPLMGAVAARLAEVVVVTDDNPRSEVPSDIRAQILTGAFGVSADVRAELLEIAGRENALQHVTRLACPGDVVMALGKGHETTQEINGVRYPLDDRAVLRRAIRGSQS